MLEKTELLYLITLWYNICKFEDLCRQLFANENISGNKQFKYLHANPNNHGLEAEPIYDETNKRWIGF